MKLELGQDRAFFIDSGPLSHAFVPCGHVTTEKTTQSVITLTYTKHYSVDMGHNYSVQV